MAKFLKLKMQNESDLCLDGMKGGAGACLDYNHRHGRVVTL
ncbi:hypothetical protein ACO22_07720 [Paracoccidioides brasiliensis]|uniref:Uncharacterized protein n=1 Tax=Paracoccidioides brasiliensis TaxID=121759 RepID=A0A1D2J3T7_PARBR|nr:hypothetical protein ACO22_07720 [Paracoccidioides brasiliensis]